MIPWVRLALCALVVPLASCGGSDDGGTPEGESASPSASVSSSGSPTAGSSATSETSGTPAEAGDLDTVLRAALKPLLDGPVIDFRHDVYSGSALAVETKGRAFQQAGWQATTVSPKQLGSGEAPEGGAVKGRMDVRAVDADLYMQLSTWPAPLAGCWLRTGAGQVPGGQLAMSPGVPGYVTLLGALRPATVVSQEADTTVVGADVPLRIGLQLLTTGVLGLLQLDASQLDGATVPVGVRITGDTVTGVELLGGDLVDAVRTAGGEVSADGEATLDQLRVAVTYRPGPADAPVVTAPAADLVMTKADVDANRGCGS